MNQRSFSNRLAIVCLLVIITISGLLLLERASASEQAPVLANPETSGGPDSFGYTFRDSNEPGGPLYAWEEISASGTLIENWYGYDDDYAGPLQIGFDFNYYESDFSEFYVSTNGYISFGQGWGNIVYGMLPDIYEPNNDIGLFGGDMYLYDYGVESRVYYQTLTDPDRLVLEFINLHYCCGYNTPHTFEVILYENGDILSQYSSLNGTSSDYVGIENSDGSDGLGYGVELADELAIRYYYPEGVFINPSAQQGFAKAGETVPYTLEIVNMTGETDSFDLEVLPGNAWTTTLSTDQVGPIEDGENVSFTAWVEIPLESQPGDSDIASIQATSVASPSITATATLNTQVLGDEIAYVTLEDSSMVAMVDVTTQSIIGAIDTGQYGCYSPWRASMTPDGAFVYFGCYSSGSVLVIDTTTNSVVANILDIPSADDIVFTQSGEYALVGSRWSDQIAVIDTATYGISQYIFTDSFPRSLAMHPYMERAYATSGDGEILVIDTSTFAILNSIHVGGNPWDVEVSPDGAWVFAGDRDGAGLWVIDANNNALYTTVSGIGELTGLEVSSDGAYLYAGGLWGEVWVIDGYAFTPITTVYINGTAWELALTGDDAQLYVGNVSNEVAVIDALNFSVSGYIPMPGDTSRGIAITPQSVAKGAFLIPPAQAKAGGRGASVVYQESLLNASDITEIFDLEALEHQWDTQLSTNQVGPLASGESESFTITITVPVDAVWYDTDEVTLLATGIASPSLTADAQLTTTAFSPAQISVTPDSLESTQYAGEVITHTMTISNGEGVTLTYEIWAGSGVGAGFFVNSTLLYGYTVPETSLMVIGTEDDTYVQVIDLATGAILAENVDLDRFGTWEVYPINGTYYKVEADKPVVAYESDWDGWSHTTFIPSLHSGPVGNEFIFYYYRGYYFSSVYVYAIEGTDIEVYDTLGSLVASQALSAGEYWDLSLPNAVYHVISTGRISIETVGGNGYSTVPATTGKGVGNRFYFATVGDFTGAFAVFAYQDTEVDVFDLDSDELLYSQEINQGDYWWQRDVGTRRLRLESTGRVEVWAGDAEGCCGIEYLGDDISFAGGDNGREFYLHSLIDGSIIFALFDNTTIDVDGTIYVLNEDEYLYLEGCCYLRHIQSTQPILIQTLGRDETWNDEGTYLGGLTLSTEVVPWLTITPVTGTVPTLSSTDIQVSFDATGMQPDIYTATITIQSNDPAHPRIEVPVTMTVALPVTPTAVSISGVESGLVGIPYTFTATVEPVSTTLPLTYVWQASGQLPITHTAGLSDTVGFAWELPGTYDITVSAANLAGSVSDSHVVTIAPSTYELYLPFVQKSGQSGQATDSSLLQSGILIGLAVVGIVGRFRKNR